MLKQASVLRRLQDSIGKTFAAIPLDPNHWTVLSLLLAVAGAVTIAIGDLVSGIILFALAGAFDLIDGAVARARNQATAFGGFMDGVADRFVEALFLFSFMLYPLPTILLDAPVWIAGVIFLGTCMPSFIRAYADHKSVIKKETALALGGICERSERLILIIIGIAAGIILSMDYFVYALILVCALSLITIIQRLLQIKNNLI